MCKIMSVKNIRYILTICWGIIVMIAILNSAKAKNYTSVLNTETQIMMPSIGVMTNLTVADGLSSDIVRSIYRDSHNLLWVGTSSGLNRWDGHKMRVYTAEQTGLPLQSDFVDALQEDANGNLWLEWDSKNLVYLRNTDRFIPAADYITDFQPKLHYNILIDNSKNIWAFDETGHLLLFDKKRKSKGKIKLARDFGNRLSWTSLPEGGILILCSKDGIFQIGTDMKKDALYFINPGHREIA